MQDEVGDDLSQMAFVNRDQEVEASAADRANQSFAEPVGFGRSNRGLQDAHAETLHLGIEARRKDRVAVVNQKRVRLIERQELAELLDGPLGCGMTRNVGVQNPPRADLHRHEHVQNLGRGFGDRQSRKPSKMA